MSLPVPSLQTNTNHFIALSILRHPPTQIHFIALPILCHPPTPVLQQIIATVRLCCNNHPPTRILSAKSTDHSRNWLGSHAILRWIHYVGSVKLEKSSLVISVSPKPSAYGLFLPDTCHVHLPLSFVSLPQMCWIQYSIRFPTFRQHPPALWQLYPHFRVLLGRRTLSCSFPEESSSREPMVVLQQC